MKFELISFPTCPYVQRTAILLLHKKADFDLTYIDLRDPPEWFSKISPLGKVPVLRFDNGKEVLFESAVINEYLDEVLPPRLLPSDPLPRAQERAWIEVSSSLFGDFYELLLEGNSTDAEKLKVELFSDLERFESVVRGPFFQGPRFSLLDAAIAPLFMRLFLVPKLATDEEWKKIPRVRSWAEALLALPEVKDSVREDFAQSYLGSLRQRKSIWV